MLIASLDIKIVPLVAIPHKLLEDYRACYITPFIER